MPEDRENIADVLADIQREEAIGDFLSAFERAESAIERFPQSEELKYLAVRAMARAGSPGRAAELYAEFDLHTSDNVDVAALEARVAKDRFIQTGFETAHAARSATLYEQGFDTSGAYFPGINAATMWALAGELDKAQSLARTVLGICERTADAESPPDFWLAATHAEALLLLGRTDDATAQLAAAAAVAPPGFDAVASTARQLRLICDKLGLDDGLLAVLPRPKVLFYSGHIIAAVDRPGRFPASREAEIAADIGDTLDKGSYRLGYGSLAAGADILFAEALLARESELHVVLPFELEEFKAVSVLPSGAAWGERFDACLQQATSLTYATTGAYLGHNILFGYTAKIAMGLASIRARALESTAEMVAVWDGVSTGGEAGTSADIDFWRRLNLPATIISVTPDAPPPQPAAPVPHADTTDPALEPPARFIGPVLFADVKGFSKISEEQLPLFSRHVFGPLGEIVGADNAHVLFTNTWGDAVHVVFDDTVAAARCALEMQKTLAAIDCEALGLPAEIGMRVSLHVGPVFQGYDPINDEQTYYGQTLTRAARMEPVTPIGEVYVTEQYAALIELERALDFRCNYVGNVPLAKDFGNLRMYRLVDIGESTG